MKKILIFVVTLLLCTSCYSDYVKDFDFTSVYFFKQHNTRTVVVGEKMDIEFGVVLTGVLSNEENRTVNYQINPDLVTADAIDGFINNTETYVKAPFIAADETSSPAVTELTAMPTDWYKVSNASKFVIPKGDHLGKVKVTFDEKFIEGAGKDTRLPFYVMPLEILSAPSVDKVNDEKNFTLVAIVYESKLYGNYYHSGVTEVTNAAGEVVETLKYKAEVNQPEDAVWSLSTVAPKVLECNKLSNGSVAGGMRLTLNDDNTISIETSQSFVPAVDADGVTAAVPQVTGEGVFNNSKLLQNREISLTYEYKVGDLTYTATDKLEFRNRIRDGINETRDENPENYK